MRNNDVTVPTIAHRPVEEICQIYLIFANHIKLPQSFKIITFQFVIWEVHWVPVFRVDEPLGLHRGSHRQKDVSLLGAALGGEKVREFAVCAREKNITVVVAAPSFPDNLLFMLDNLRTKITFL